MFGVWVWAGKPTIMVLTAAFKINVKLKKRPRSMWMWIWRWKQHGVLFARTRNCEHIHKENPRREKWERKINLNPLNEIHFFCRFALPQSFILCFGGIWGSSEGSSRRKKFDRFLSSFLSSECQARLPLSIFVLANKFPVVPIPADFVDGVAVVSLQNSKNRKEF